MLAISALVAFCGPLVALAAPLGSRDGVSSNNILALQFANVLEQLETQFYKQALQTFKASDFTAAGFNNPQLVIDQLTIIGQDEATHTSVLQAALNDFGATPITTCKFDFSSVLTDVKTTVHVARIVENLGVSAYLGAAALLVDNIQILTAAASILTVEARHETIHNLLAGGSSINSAFDMALSPSQVLAIAGGFISGCDLGVPANSALTVTNTGPVTIGTQLSFSSDGFNGTSQDTLSSYSCQMMVGGAIASIPFNFTECVVPPGIDGLVYLYITKSNQPLLSDLTVQFSADIVAGPTAVFIDTQQDLLAGLISSSPIDGNPQFVAADACNDNNGGSGNDTSSSPPPSSDPSNDSPSSASAASLGGTTAFATTTMPAAAASSFLASLSSASLGSPTGSAAPTITAAPPTNVGGPAAVADPGPNTLTGLMGGANVIGWSSTTALPVQSGSPQRRWNKKVRTAAERYAAW